MCCSSTNCAQLTSVFALWVVFQTTCFQKICQNEFIISQNLCYSYAVRASAAEWSRINPIVGRGLVEVVKVVSVDPVSARPVPLVDKDDLIPAVMDHFIDKRHPRGTSTNHEVSGLQNL